MPGEHSLWETFCQAYLFAWVFWMTLTNGCIGLLILHHAVRGSWGLVILRVLESGAKMLPFMAVAFLPIAINVLGGGHLYHWVHPGDDKILAWKAPFLNKGAFIGVTYFCFLIWWFWTNKLTASSLREDRTGNLNERQMRSNWGAAGLVMFVLTNTFTWTHWVMSLDPHWFSTIFPAWFIVCSGLIALSFCSIYTTTRHLKGIAPWRTVVTPFFRKDMGNLMMVFCLVWAYFSLSQFLIMYSGNLPEEITYYAKRMNDPIFSAMGTFLIFFQWLVPFVALLAPRSKNDPRLLLSVASLIMVTRFVDLIWTITPFYKMGVGADSHFTQVLLLCFILCAGLGAVWMTLFNGIIKRETPVPSHDSRLEVAVSHV